MNGQKNAFVTFILSMLPGAGHLYLGLNKRGLQFMAAFFGTIVLIDAVRVGPIMPFVLIIVWFYSMFDALQLTSRINQYIAEGGGAEAAQFNPTELAMHNPIDPLWIGGGAVVLGIVLLIRSFAPGLWRMLRDANVGPGLIGLLLIGFGAYMVYRHVQQVRTGTDATGGDNTGVGQ